MSYLSDEMLPYIDPITTRQLRDCAAAVFNKKEKYSLIEMFSCELKFVIDLLKMWLAEKYFSRYKELDLFSKQRSKRENPIDWNETNCVICGFHLSTAASNFPSEKIITFSDFIIEKEDSFIRNILENDEWKLSKNNETLKNAMPHLKKCLELSFC